MSRLTSTGVQTEGKFVVHSHPKSPKVDDPFEGFDGGTVPGAHPGCEIPIRVVSYSKEKHAFRVVMADTPGEAEIGEQVLLAIAPLLIVDFFVAEMRAPARARQDAESSTEL
jgi:hypothetical protein